MITKEQYEEAIRKQEEAEEIINAYHKQSADNFEEKWKKFEKGEFAFKDEDLIYSAFARCRKCTSGLAYPKDCGMNHQWTCSDVLKGIGSDNGHEAFPFAFYEIKSENQPSAGKATTRPKLDS